MAVRKNWHLGLLIWVKSSAFFFAAEQHVGSILPEVCRHFQKETQVLSNSHVQQVSLTLTSSTGDKCRPRMNSKPS